MDGFTGEFVCGLIHSDGCRTVNRVRKRLASGDRWYEYTRYNFSNASLDIQRLFTDALDRLGIEWTQMTARNFSVAKRRRWRGWTGLSGLSTECGPRVRVGRVSGASWK